MRRLTKDEPLPPWPRQVPEHDGKLIAQTRAELAVGVIAFTFDQNRRVYRPGERNSPLYRYHFEPVLVTGETKVSWISRVGKHPKQRRGERFDFGGSNWLYTLDEVEDSIWANQHRHRLREMIHHADAAALRQVAEVLGYRGED